ncbi:hypothetical protein OK074_6401 [Actinobacteria bacterium OK074]|nr:hypothetical protein OK074_6401 [Actinobacteria bacterium OK074]
MVIALVVVLAVAGAVLAFTLGGDDDTKDSKGAGTKSVASGGVTAKSSADSGAHVDSGSDSGKETAGADIENTADSSPLPSASTSASASGGSDSGGSGSGTTAATTYKGSQGFSIGLPKGWKYASTDSAGVRFTGPDGQRLLVAWTSTPKSDPVADWENQEKSMTRSQYQRIRIEKVSYRGWNTADWEFTYVDGGTKYRVIDRGFVVDSDQGYALLYTAKSADWDGSLRASTWKTLTETFEPKA